MNKTLLVIEDDAAIRRGVVMAVKTAGYLVVEAYDGPTAEQAITKGTYDLVLLDLILPGISGLSLLATIRDHRPTVPVIILSAMGDESDRIRGLENGADDYVVKPFSVQELLARISAVIRRSPERSQPVASFTIPHGVADFSRRELRFENGDRQELSQRESDLLAYLAANPGRAISREEIMSRVWRLDPGGLSTRAIDMQIARLREKLRDQGHEPAFLLTVRGTGYMLAKVHGAGAK